jgi:hypothetical protein
MYFASILGQSSPEKSQNTQADNKGAIKKTNSKTIR